MMHLGLVAVPVLRRLLAQPDFLCRVNSLPLWLLSLKAIKSNFWCKILLQTRDARPNVDR